MLRSRMLRERLPTSRTAQGQRGPLGLQPAGGEYEAKEGVDDDVYDKIYYIYFQYVLTFFKLFYTFFKLSFYSFSLFVDFFSQVRYIYNAAESDDEDDEELYDLFSYGGFDGGFKLKAALAALLARSLELKAALAALAALATLCAERRRESQRERESERGSDESLSCLSDAARRHGREPPREPRRP
jgi:hypothetical protein